MPRPAQVMIFAKQKLFRECLGKLLAEVDRWLVLETSDDFEDMPRRVEEMRPDLLLIDLVRTGEPVAERIRNARHRQPATRVLILGGEDNVDAVLACIEAGAHGFVSKRAPFDELSAAIERVIHGEAAYTSGLAHAAFVRLAERAEANRRSLHVEALMLTQRELEVLGLIAEGRCNKEIADLLFLSIYTVKNHVHHILAKLRVSSRSQAVDLARARHWLETEPTRLETEPADLASPARAAAMSWARS